MANAELKARDYQNLVELSVDLICIARPGGRFLYVNSVWERMLGYTRDELLAGTQFDFMHPDDRSGHENKMAIIASDQQTRSFENRYLHKDGTIRHIAWTVAPVASEKKLYCIGRDITGQELAEQHSQANEARYRAMYDNALVALFRTRLDDGRVIAANQAAAKLFGYDSVDEFIEKFMAANHYANPEDRPTVIKELREEGFIDRIELHSKKVDGTLIWNEASFQANVEEGFVECVAVDITQRKAAAEALKESLEHENFLADIIREASVAIGIGFVDGRVGIHNNALRKLTGYSEKELDEIDWNTELTPQKWRELEARKLQELQHTQKPVSYKKEFVRKDGTVIPVELFVQGHFDDQGEIEYYKGFITDITDRQTAEVALGRSTQLLEASQAIARVGGWELDVATNELFWTAETYRIHDTSPDEFNPTVDAGVGYFLPESRRLISAALEAAIERGEGYDLELEMLTTKGRRIDVRTTCEATRHDGRTVKLTGIIQDITLQKAAERALRESEERFRRLVEQAPISIQIHDHDGRLIQSNAAYTKLFGLDERTLAKVVQNYNIRQDEQARRLGLMPLIEKVYTGEEAVFPPYEYDGAGTLQDIGIDPPSSRTCWLLTRGFPLKDNEGKITSAVFISEDITAKKLAEDAVIASKARLSAIFTSSPLAISLTRLEDQQFAEVNPAWEKLTGYSRSEGIGATSHELNIYTDNAQRVRVFEELRARGKVSDVEVRLRRKSGEIIFLLFSAELIKLDGVSQMLSMAWNITDRKLAEDERTRLKSQLLQAQKMESVGTLAGGIAHDFNNILTSILGYAELALAGVEPDTELAGDLRGIEAAGQRAKSLVQQILTFARQSEESTAPIHVSTIAKEALKFLRASVPATIEFRHTTTSKSVVMANASKIHQIFMNLCTNAAQAMESSKGLLEVTVHDVVLDAASTELQDGTEPGAYVQIKISDTGVGIRPGTIDMIFEPYFTTKEPGAGTGMGLAMVHGIVKECGGMISVESKIGEGSVFTIYLPAIKSGKTVHLQEKTMCETGSERILIVDDEPVLAKIMGRVLAAQGYRVTEKTSSVEALALFKSTPDDFDLVITDMTMPKMTGYQLINELLKIRPSIPTIICTGYSKVLPDDGTIKANYSALAHKPIGRVELAEMVRRVLDEADGVAADK